MTLEKPPIPHFPGASTNIHVAIVLPYLNEEARLADTCASLGFGIGSQLCPQNVSLFLIDNGSIDNSGSVADHIKRDSLNGSVFLGREEEQGYVPPRHRGNLMAADRKLIDSSMDQVLILQADADTHYAKGYISSMRVAAEKAGKNSLIEAAVAYPEDFISLHAKYIDMCQQVDRSIEPFFASWENDVIVDDKVCGYWLTDYFKWGGHQREYNACGDEIYSESARLFIRAKSHGATRVAVSAQAYPSMRKVISEPALHFANAGFPREFRWSQGWRKQYKGPVTLRDFYSNLSDPEVQKAMQVRKQHLFGLFAVLPLHVQNALGSQRHKRRGSDDLVGDLSCLLPRRNAVNCASSPSVFITDVFDLIEAYGHDLLTHFEELRSRSM